MIPCRRWSQNDSRQEWRVVAEIRQLGGKFVPSAIPRVMVQFFAQGADVVLVHSCCRGGGACCCVDVVFVDGKEELEWYDMTVERRMRHWWALSCFCVAFSSLLLRSSVVCGVTKRQKFSFFFVSN